MKLGILTASVSNKAGGIFGAVLGQNKALHNLFDTKLQIFGLNDELSQQDLVTWAPLSVTTCIVHGPNKFGYSPELVPALQEANLDLLHVHGLWMYPSIASSKWARLGRKPYLITIHGMLDPWAVHNSRWEKRFAGWLYENSHLRNAGCLQAVTKSEVGSIRAYGLRNPICLIPYGIDLPQKRSLANSVAQEPKVLLYLGRLHPKKGLINLLYAWHAMQNCDLHHAEEWRLTIAGWDQGGYELELKKLCKDLRIERSVHFIGARFGIEKESTYCDANAFILPSFSEGLPVVILEAWAYQLPVLITPQCNLPEGFHAGAAIPIRTDVEGIVSGLRQLMSMTNNERQSMGVRGRQLVEGCYSWKTIATEMYSVYQWMLSGRGKPDCVVTT